MDEGEGDRKYAKQLGSLGKEVAIDPWRGSGGERLNVAGSLSSHLLKVVDHPDVKMAIVGRTSRVGRPSLENSQ